MQTWNSFFFFPMLSIPIVLSSPSCCSSAVLPCIYTGLHPSHLNHMSSATDVHEGFAPLNWFVLISTILWSLTIQHCKLELNNKSPNFETHKERAEGREEKGRNVCLAFVCLEKNRQYFQNISAVWPKLLPEENEISLRGIRELELLGSCSNFSANFLHDLGYGMCLSTVTYRKDT